MTGLNDTPTASDVSGLGALATQSTVNLASQAVSGAYATAFTATAATALTLPTEGKLLSGIGGKTYSIAHAGGGDFANLNAAVAYLDYNLPIGGATINMDAGTHAYSVPVYVGQNWFKDVLIQGAAPVAVNVTGIASSSGSAGAWSIVLNVSSTAGITTAMYAAIYLVNYASGINPIYIEGVWPITAVGSGTITISTTHRYASAPSGAVTASLAALGTVLHFTGCDGFRLWDCASAINMSNVVIVGDGSAHNGISLQDLGRINSSGVIAVTNFGGYNVYLNLNSEMNGLYLISSGSGSHGICMDSGAVLDMAGEIVSSGNAAKGIYADGGSFIRALGNSSGAQGIVVSGNAGDGAYLTGGAVLDPYALGMAGGNGGYGWHSDCGGKFVRSLWADVNNASGGKLCSQLSLAGSLTNGFGVTSTPGGLVTAGAGSASIPPLLLTAGTNLTTPVAGATEYDGHALYFDPAAGVAGVIPVLQRSSVTASGGVALNNDANAQSFLPSGAQTFPVQSGQLYRFRAKLLLSMGTSTTRTKSFLFATGGGAAFSWIAYTTSEAESASAIIGGGQMNLDYCTVSTGQVLTGTTTNQYGYAIIEGEFVMSSGGTVQPQIQFSAAPGGTNINMRGSYFELHCEGAAATVGLT